MDGLALWERHQGINQYSTTVLWGAIGEIGLRKAIYGSRDVFAQFDLGQKLIGPADTAFLEKAVCLNSATWDFVGAAAPQELLTLNELEEKDETLLKKATKSLAPRVGDE
eukprot:Skav209714  [mRNA]  locus=scaffold528:74651:78278:- [translate_table: standard]